VSQNVELLKYLKQGRRLTAAKAARELGIWRLAARVADLRESGHNVVTVMLAGKNGSRFAQYHLSQSRPQK
jgi:23S rRNA pseudoU1915 N3-methylase RlmH